MNTLLALALACTLSTAPTTDDKITSAETSTYVVTNKLAIWLTDAGKLKLLMAKLPENATIELWDEEGVLYQRSINLRDGAQQTLDLSQVPDGTYRIKVTIGQEVTAKTIQIGQVQERTFRLK